MFNFNKLFYCLYKKIIINGPHEAKLFEKDLYIKYKNKIGQYDDFAIKIDFSMGIDNQQIYIFNSFLLYGFRRREKIKNKLKELEIQYNK